MPTDVWPLMAGVRTQQQRTGSGSVMLSARGEAIEVRVRRSSRARRFSLRLSESRREVVLTIPKRSSLAAALTFLQTHADWVAEHRGRWAPVEPLADDRLIPLRGVLCRIHRIEGAGPPRFVAAETEGGESLLVVPASPGRLRARILVFLRSEARRDLEAAVVRYAAELGVPSPRLRLGDPKSRWGSCTSKGMLSFSWRLVLAPQHVLDYVAAHEVAHLKELNHGRGFWALVERLDPNYRVAETWLKRNGAALHRYAA